MMKWGRQILQLIIPLFLIVEKSILASTNWKHMFQCEYKDLD